MCSGLLWAHVSFFSPDVQALPFFTPLAFQVQYAQRIIVKEVVFDLPKYPRSPCC
jgi:hypothetical protein